MLPAAMSQPRDHREPEPSGGTVRPQLGQNATPFLDSNPFNNTLLPSPASLQLAQLQAHLTLQRLKFAQSAVTSNTAAATVLNQVLSKVAMSQPLFNPLRNATMIGAHGVSSLASTMHNARFPSSGVPFSAQNQAMAPKHPSQNSMPTFGKGMGGSKPGTFYSGSKAFSADNEQPVYHGFTGNTTSSSSTADGQYGPKHDHPSGYKKEYFDTQGQHQSMSKKGDIGLVPHGNTQNNQWESSRVWQSPNQHYEARNELYNPEEPTPDTKFSPSNSPAFSRHNNGKTANCATNMKTLQPHELNDFHGIPPLHLPHTCTMCDKKVFNLKDWELHVKGRMHIQKVMGVSENAGIHCVSSVNDGILAPSMNTDFTPVGNEGFPGDVDQLYMPSAPAASFLQSGLPFPGPPSSAIKFAQRKSNTGRVVHICNLPEGSCNENDVVNLGLPFGKVTNYILMKSTNQAFLEMAYIEAAEAMVQYYQEKPAMINDEKLLIRMSKRYQELQLKKPGKNVDAIIHDIHSQRERDIFRDTDRYRNERTRSRSPVSRSLSPRSHTPSYTSCSSTHSPLGTTRTEWGNGRESWDQTAYGRWEEDREQGAWRDSAEEKRDRTDHWVHERKHYSRQLEKLDLDDRTDASRGHRDKYGNPHSTRYKGREGEYYRKESKLKSEGKSQDISGKPKRKEEGKVRDVKGSHSEDISKKEISEPKSMKECDSEKDTDKSKKINSSGEEELNEGIKKSKDERPIDKKKENNILVSGSNKQGNKLEDAKTETARHKEEDWESGSETWYPTNMEELVTVDEVGEEDLIIEPDITELEEIVSMEPKESLNCIQMCPHGMSTVNLECRSNQSSRSECSSPQEASIAMSYASLRETASPASSSCGPVANVPDININTEQKLEEKEVSSRASSLHEKEDPGGSSENRNKVNDLQAKDCIGNREDNLDTCVGVYNSMDLQEDNNVKLMSMHAQEERHDTRDQDLSISEEKSLEVPEFGSKEIHSSPSWEQDDVFTDLSIPLGVEFVVPRTGFYCKLCGLFYTSEEVAKTSHCRSRVHYKNLQGYLSRLADGSLGKAGMEGILHQDDVGIVPQFERNRP
ncbi:RNA-binding protein 20 [Pelobates fuscus]|uniref:RNA-binding protein 20 n=1 Tax=Pelobates fuscus TaxID=191477 RepID=UPI002FE48BEB